MTFRFACHQCGQLFSVSAGKTGLRLKCPRCQASITVPAAEDAEAQAAAWKTTSPRGPNRVLPEPPRPETYGSVEETEPAQRPYVDDTDHDVALPLSLDDGTTVTVPRRVIYLQGILLGAVGVVAFVLGILVGRTWTADSDEPALSRRGPCVVQGTIVCTASDGREIPDVGSAVLAVPADTLPDEKMPVNGLRPEDPLLPHDHPTLRSLHVLGGAYARTDHRGFFELTLPRGGDYFLLFLSAAEARKDSKSPTTRELAELGRYVTSASDLIGDGQYSWRRQVIRTDARLDWTSDPASP